MNITQGLRAILLLSLVSSLLVACGGKHRKPAVQAQQPQQEAQVEKVVPTHNVEFLAVDQEIDEEKMDKYHLRVNIYDVETESFTSYQGYIGINESTEFVSKEGEVVEVQSYGDMKLETLIVTTPRYEADPQAVERFLAMATFNQEDHDNTFKFIDHVSYFFGRQSADQDLTIGLVKEGWDHQQATQSVETVKNYYDSTWADSVVGLTGLLSTDADF